MVKMTGDGMCAAFEDPRMRSRHDRIPAGARRSDRNRWRLAARALRASRGHGRTARQRFLRQRGQSRRAHHGRRPWGPGAGVAGGGRPVAEHLPAGVTLRTWVPCACAISRVPSASTRSCIPRCGRVPRAAIAVGHAEQPAAADDVVHRPRGRTVRGSAYARKRAAGDAARCRRPRQDADVAAGGRRHHGRLPGWRVARGARAAGRSSNGAAGDGLGAGGQGRIRASDSGSDGERVRDRRLLRHPRQLRAPAAGVRGDESRRYCGRGRSSRSWRPAASRCTWREKPSIASRARGTRSATGHHSRGPGRNSGDPAVRRACGGRAARFPVDRRERAGASSRSATASTASRSRSSSPRRACVRCRSRASPSVCTTASGC